MIYELVYLLLLLSGIIILLENRIRRLVLLLTGQGILLIGPVFHIYGFLDLHTYLLLGMVVLFKVILTPAALLWTIKKSKIPEHTNPRFGYLGTLFLFMLGVLATYNLVYSMSNLPKDIERIEIIYVLLMIYIGILGFIVRRHWVPLICTFIMFENGLFLLTLILHTGLPLGIELGTFVDAIMVLVAALTLQYRGDKYKVLEVK